jgi:transposase-like protein
MSRGVKHRDELRTAVVSAVRAGEGISEVAKRFGIDPTLVWRWTRVSRTVATTTDVDSRAPESVDELTARIAGYVRATLEAMDRQGLLPREHHLRKP